MASTWSGWQNMLLNRAGVIVTPPNRSFLSSWAANSDTKCPDNPVDIGHPETGSSDCAQLLGIYASAQHFASHTSAAHGFSDELHSGNFPHLLAALNSGNPFQVKDGAAVRDEIGQWGSDIFAGVYFKAWQAGKQGGNTGSGKKDAFQGWDAMRHVINHKVPVSLRETRKMSGAALRSMQHAHKVHH